MRFSICILILTATLYSCKSTRLVKSETSLKGLSGLAYTEPIYEFENEEVVSSKRGRLFVKYTTHIMDSIFKADSLKYKIGQKLIPQNKEVFHSYLQEELKTIMSEIALGTSPDTISIPEKLYIIDDPQLHFLMVPMIRPKLKFFGTGYSSPNRIVISSRPHYKVTEVEVNIFIFDLRQNKVAFFGQALEKLKYSGFRKKFIKDINTMYKFILEDEI